MRKKTMVITALIAVAFIGSFIGYRMHIRNQIMDGPDMENVVIPQEYQGTWITEEKNNQLVISNGYIINYVGEKIMFESEIEMQGMNISFTTVTAGINPYARLEIKGEELHAPVRLSDGPTTTHIYHREQ